MIIYSCAVDANPTECWMIHVVNVFRCIIFCELASIVIKMGGKSSNEIEIRALFWTLAHEEQAYRINRTISSTGVDANMFIIIVIFIVIIIGVNRP